MKLKLLTIAFIVLYIINFSSHIADVRQGYNEAPECSDDKEYITLVVKQTPSENVDSNSSDIQIKETNEILKIEVPYQEFSKTTDYLYLLLGILALFISPILIIVSIKFFKNLFIGNIVSSAQINRLKFIAYSQLLLPIIQNIIVFYLNKEQQEVADLYSLSLVKYDYDFSLFIIPLILLLIIEISKQHLSLKENAELTI
jgi:hypothetical protein